MDKVQIIKEHKLERISIYVMNKGLYFVQVDEEAFQSNVRRT